MKKFILICSIYLSISISFSQTYYLNVNLKDGTKVTYEVEKIDKLDFSDITSLEEVKKLQHMVKSFKLAQNFPNPFNPSTTIQYDIPHNGNVVVGVFDINGRLVKNLVNQNQQAGNHRTVWNGKNRYNVRVASGLYFYSVKFENSIYSKKMILIK